MKKGYVILAALLVFILSAVVSPVTANTYAQDQTVYNGTKLTKITESDSAFMKQYDITLDQTLPVIVELKGSSVADETELIETYGSVYDALLSSEGKKLTEEKNAIISSAKASITRLLPKGSYTFGYEYNTAILGISMTTTVGNMYRIRELECVSRAYLAHSVVRLDTELTAEPYMLSSGSMIGSAGAHDLGYTGKGTLVAVLDTGIDASHEAFQGEVPDPKYTRESITEFLKTASLTSGAVSGNTYRSQKLPYAYDYADNDSNVTSTLDHGMHVSGIVAANSGEIEGVAYDAQIAFMKVFDDYGYSSSVGILAALDDAIKLGADVVNMSLGLSAGLLEANQSVAETYERVFNSGVTLCVAMGNDSYQGLGDLQETNLPLAANPDYGLTATPAAYLASMGVASADNVKVFTQYVASNGIMTNFSDSAEKESDMIFNRFKGQDLAYEIIPGTGRPEDYEGIDVGGKVAVVERGVLSFSDKIKYAYEQGAIAVIVYNNEETSRYVSMQITERYIPSAFVMRQFGLHLKNQTNKILRFDEGLLGNPSGGQISSFSMRGATSDLRLKPEITAPGGSIYSSIANNGYASYSGTSMASPQVAGGSAVVRQYLKELFPDKDAHELSVITKQLLMSTATPIIQENGVIATPRSQGAGMMNLEAAVTSGAYLYVKGSDYTKAELGYNTEGKYSFEFVVKNITDKSLEYSVGYTVVTDEATEINGIKYVTLNSRELGGDYAIVAIKGLTDGKVKVDANGETTLSVEIELTDAGKRYIEADFENGSFVEGFIYLKPELNATQELSFVFMGFYGDWLAIPALDGSLYGDESDIFMQPSAALLLNTNSGQGTFLGINQADGTVLGDRIRYSNKLGSAARFTYLLGLRRSITSATMTITDKDGNVVFSESSGAGSKSFFYNSSQSVTYYFGSDGWQAYDETGSAYPDGTEFTCTIEVIPEAGKPADNSRNVFTFDFAIDNIAPVIESYEIKAEEGKTYLELKVSDNDYLQYLQITDFTDQYRLGDLEAFNESESGSTQTVLYDITGLADEMKQAGLNPSRINLLVADMAMNTTTQSIVIGPQLLQIESSAEIAKGATLGLNWQCYPRSYPAEKLVWTSSDQSVATVENGRVTAKNFGETVIRVSSLSGLYAECKVTVRGIADRSVSLDFTLKTVTIGDEFTLKATVYPTEATDKTVNWSSSDESVATVENGKVTAVGVGSAEIYALSKYGNSAKCVVTVNPVYAEEVIPSLTQAEIIIGDSLTLSAKVKPNTATYKDVTWSSRDESVVTVDENGVITAVGIGETVVRATSYDGKAYADVRVSVLPREVTEISAVKNVSVDIGEEIGLVYTVLPENATYKDVTVTVDGECVSYENGVIKGLKVGKSTLTLTANNGVSATVSVSVNPVYAQSVTFESSVSIMAVGDVATIKATVLPENATFRKLFFVSSNEAVAVVNGDGVIVAVGEGNAVISAETFDGVKAVMNLTVKAKTYAGIYVEPVRDMKTGESKVLQAEIVPTDGNISDIEWTSSDENVAFVDGNGVLRALNKGKATIKATIGNVSYEFEVKVSQPVSVLTAVLLVAVIFFAGAFAAILIKLNKDKKKSA